jgi:hypothetical protein
MRNHDFSHFTNVTVSVTHRTVPLLVPQGISVAGAYRIERRVLDGRDVNVMTADWQAEVPGTCWPVRERSLADDFAQVTNDQLLREFNSRYGLLGYAQLHEAEMLHRKETWQGDPVPWALAHAATVAGILGAVEIINEVREGKRKLTARAVPFLLRTLFGEFEKMGLRVKLERRPFPLTILEWSRPEMMMSQSCSPLRKKFSSRWGNDPIGTAYVALTWVLNQYVRRARFEFTSLDYERRFFGMPADEPRFGLELRWDTLLEVIYWQVAERVGGAFRVCPECGLTFPVKGKQLYHSKRCAGAARIRRYRADANEGRKKEKMRRKRKGKPRR